MRAVQIEAYGNPPEVVKLFDVPEPAPAVEGEVLVEVLYAPVNFNDLLVIGGDFPVHPPTPAFMGNEGVARVLATGPDVDAVKVGDLVVPPLYGGTWRERMVIPASDLFALPETIDLKQAAMLRINPPTAALILDEYVQLEPGEWVIQNAATSGVGHSFIALAHARGLRTVNLVRRPEAVQDVLDAGGDVVLVDEGLDPARISEATGGAAIRLAADGVLGSATARLASFLAPGGTLVNYAQMSGETQATGDLRKLMNRNLSLHGFYQAVPRFRPKIPAILREAAGLVAAGRIVQPISDIYPLERIGDAVAAVQAGRRILIEVRGG